MLQTCALTRSPQLAFVFGDARTGQPLQLAADTLPEMNLEEQVTLSTPLTPRGGFAVAAAGARPLRGTEASCRAKKQLAAGMCCNLHERIRSRLY